MISRLILETVEFSDVRLILVEFCADKAFFYVSILSIDGKNIIIKLRDVMTIKQKLLGSGMVLSLMIIALLTVSIYSFTILGNGFLDIIDKSEIGVSNSETSKSNISGVNQDLSSVSKTMQGIADEINQTNQNMKLLERKIKQISANLGEFTQSLEEMTADIPEGDLLYDLQDMTDSIGDIEEIMRREALIGLNRTAKKLFEFTDSIGSQVNSINKLSVDLNKVDGLSNEVVKANQDIHKLSNDFNTDITVSRNLIVGLLVIIGIFALGFSMLLARSIAKRMDQAVNALNDIAEGEGDLTHRLNESGNDEISSLAKAFNLFSSKIQNMIGQVTDASQLITEAVDKVTHVNDLTKGTVEEQDQERNRVQESVHNITSSIQQVATNAANAAEAAKQADTQANQGRDVVASNRQSIQKLADEVVSAEGIIQALEEKSNDIGTILDTIRGVAEQTNLLALNAAIEAARAGENGRGFAVVADEVRTLAHKTHDSTNEIQEMIQALQDMAQKSVKAMENGRNGAEASVQHANAVGNSLDDISDTIHSISDMNTDIAKSTDNQLSATVEIEKNIANISKITDTTINGVSYTEKALIDLGEQLARLQQLVSQFKIV